MKQNRIEQIFSKIIDNNYFDKAEELYPEYNWKQSKDATEYVLKLVYDNLLSEHEKLTWTNSDLKKELYLMIHGGLT